MAETLLENRPQSEPKTDRFAINIFLMKNKKKILRDIRRASLFNRYKIQRFTKREKFLSQESLIHNQTSGNHYEIESPLNMPEGLVLYIMNLRILQLEIDNLK